MERLAPGDRPRERARELGLAALTTQELVALLLGQGTAGVGVLELAARLLGDVGGARGLARLDIAGLRRPGIGPAKALRLAAAFELGRRVDSEREGAAVLASSHDLARHFGPRLRDERQEVLMLALLSARLRVLRTVELARGSVGGAALPLDAVLGTVLREGCVRFALVHNHPSGDPTPSTADERTTARVAAGAMLVGIELVDHVILGSDGRYASFADLGLLEPWKAPQRARKERR